MKTIQEILKEKKGEVRTLKAELIKQDEVYKISFVFDNDVQAKMETTFNDLSEASKEFSKKTSILTCAVEDVECTVKLQIQLSEFTEEVFDNLASALDISTYTNLEYDTDIVLVFEQFNETIPLYRPFKAAYKDFTVNSDPATISAIKSHSKTAMEIEREIGLGYVKYKHRLERLIDTCKIIDKYS